MKISTLMKLIELDGTEAPQVRNPKVVKVSPNAPMLQSKDKHPMILQSENPEEVEEQSIDLMSTYGGGPLEKGKTINPPGTVAAKLAKYQPSPKTQPSAGIVLQPPKKVPSFRLAPAEESILIPYILEGKKKQKSSVLGTLGILTIAVIIGGVAAYFESKERRDCFSKTGREGFECRKKLKLRKIETQIGLLRKRLHDCHTKISKDREVLRQYCVETTADKILDLREKYRQEMSKEYKGSNR